MSNYHRQASRKSARTHVKSRQYINYLARSLALLGLITSGSPLWLLPVIAAPTAPNVTIDNQATGTFADLDDTSAGTQNVVSNTVSVTVAEVAGIVITSVNTPNAVLGTTANFDFKIQNIGNDPTTFFLPTDPADITGGTLASPLQIVAYIRADGTQINLTTPINITAPTATTGTFEGNTTLGSIPADAAIVVRVPVNISSGATSVSVTLGNTSGPPNNINTPYVIGGSGSGSNDVYTVDHLDPTSAAGETTGVPVNGIREASATKVVTAIPAATVTCPTGTTGSGGGYATGGSGQYLTKNAIYWLDWNCGTTSQFNPGSIVTKSWTAPNGVVVTATISQITQAIQPYNTGSYGGDKLDDLYSGVNPIGLINVTDSEDPSYKITFTMTLNGVPIQSDIVTAEAESTDGPNESATWATDGDAWEPLETSTGDVLNATFSNAGKTIKMDDATNSGFGTLIAIAENVTNINVDMQAGGKEALAFGIMVPFDHGDAPTSYGSAPHFARRDASGGSKPTTSTPVGNLTLATLGYGTPYLGAIGPDPESTDFTTAANAPATGDNTNGTSDEDGFTTLPNVPAIGSYALNNIPVNNISGTSAILHAWVDFNKDGKFQATEYTSVSIPANATTANLNWASIPTGTTVGATYARFRITTQSVNDNPATTAVDERSTATLNDGEVEDYDVSIAIPTVSISGTVFEDPNYGGGAGRPLSTGTTAPRDGATVELYQNDATGTYVGTTTTSGGGKYTFTGVAPGDYRVRVVNSTVTSSRPNPNNATGLVAVQTFRTDAGVTAGTVSDVIDRVGGEIPKEVDAPANTTASLTTLNTVANKEVQSLTAVKVGANSITGIDFGYNFDSIVNTNNTGQGSLRQFVTNSNALTNAGLAQSGQTAGKEVSIFMIPDGTAHPGLSSTYASGLNGTGGNANAAVISLSTQLIITDSNTSIDARTQTTNVGDSNTGTMGTGGTVGTDGVALSLIPKPEVVLDFSPMPTVNGNLNPSGGGSNPIVIQGQSTTLAGFAFYGYKISQGLGGLNKGTIWVTSAVTDAGKATLTQLFGGTLADGTKPPLNSLVGSGLQTSGGAEISNSYFAYLADAADFENLNGSQAKFFNNELAFNGPQTTSTNDMSGLYADQLETGTGSKNITVSGNLIRNSNKINATSAQGQGIQISNSTFVTVENNSFIDNNIFGINASASDTLIQKNIVTGTKNGPGFSQGSGVIVYYGGTPLTGLRNRISQNSIYNNFKLGIDRQIDGVTPNDGLLSATEPNNGMDYPIITASNLIGNTLNVKGYIGIDPLGKSIFGNANIEFFIADNTDSPSQNGAVIIGDGKLKSHGEGRTYIGNCTATAVGLFNCSFANAGTLGLTDPKNITATATDSAGNTSEFSAVPSSKANVLMAKRITAVKDGVSGTVTPYNTFIDDTTSTTKTNDNNCGWPGAAGTGGVCTTNTYTVGATSETALKIKPGDEIEYTIYYLNAGENKATQARICDRLDNNLTFKDDTPTTPPTIAPLNIQFVPGGGAVQPLTNLTDTDGGQLTTPTLAGDSCNLIANTGTNLSNNVVVVDVGTTSAPVMGSTGVGIPTTSYGYIRFKTTVK